MRRDVTLVKNIVWYKLIVLVAQSASMQYTPKLTSVTPRVETLNEFSKIILFVNFISCRPF